MPSLKKLSPKSLRFKLLAAMYDPSANLPFNGIAIIDLNSFVSITSSDSNFEPSFSNKTTLPFSSLYAFGHT